MPDLCKSGQWDIDPKADCPICGAKPDTDCDGGAKAMRKRAMEKAAIINDRPMRVPGGAQT